MYLECVGVLECSVYWEFCRLCVSVCLMFVSVVVLCVVCIFGVSVELACLQCWCVDALVCYWIVMLVH